MTSTTQQCPLMELPGELRNRIYRFALLEARIMVTARGLSEPGLLTVCKRIRKEASPIFYAENRFIVNIDDYDATAACFMHVKFNAVSREFGLTRLNPLVGGAMRPNWANVLRWLRSYHGKRTSLSVDAECLKAVPAALWPSVSIVQAMFRTVGAVGDKDWRDVERLMTHFRGPLEAADSGWWPKEESDEESEE